MTLSQLSGLKEFRLNPNYTTWFKQRSTEHLQLACEYTVFLSNIDNVINNQYLYQAHFLLLWIMLQ